MSRKIAAGIVASTLALGLAACGTEVEEKSSAATPNDKPTPSEVEENGPAATPKEKAAPPEVEETGSAETPKETPAPPDVAKALRKEQKANPPSEEELEGIEDLITPELIVSMMFESNPDLKRQFCRGYELLGYKISLRSFASGYGKEPGYPPARVVFEEALSRC
jgi:hypothetical protein